MFPSALRGEVEQAGIPLVLGEGVGLVRDTVGARCKGSQEKKVHCSCRLMKGSLASLWPGRQMSARETEPSPTTSA